MPEPTPLPHAFDRAAEWVAAWQRTGRIVLLLDFDGTLAPIVERPELAAMPAATRRALERLVGCAGVDAAVVSGRGLADARERAALEGIAYAGNHGMEIEGPGIRRIHAEAAAARGTLEAVVRSLTPRIARIEGAIIEDKQLTLSVHYRLVDRRDVGRVRRMVAQAVEEHPRLRLTEGKEVLEVRPAVEWDKGRAVEFLLGELDPPPGVPILYLGDDTTDEDAFRALLDWRGGAAEGVAVADPPPATTAARAFVRDPDEVAALLGQLAERGGC